MMLVSMLLGSISEESHGSSPLMITSSSTIMILQELEKATIRKLEQLTSSGVCYWRRPLPSSKDPINMLMVDWLSMVLNLLLVAQFSVIIQPAKLPTPSSL